MQMAWRAWAREAEAASPGGGVTAAEGDGGAGSGAAPRRAGVDVSHVLEGVYPSAVLSAGGNE